jgi:hypothetical protein
MKIIMSILKVRTIDSEVEVFYCSHKMMVYNKIRQRFESVKKPLT